MVKKTPGIIFLVLLICTTCFGQTSYKGLTPGKSTRVDVDRVLGEPVTEHSQTLIEYRGDDPRLSKIYVQYRRGSPIVERIENLLRKPLNRADALAALHLPAQPTGSRINANGRLEQYFGPPSYFVLTYEGADVSKGVSRTARYSRELFESALQGNASGRTSAASAGSISGRWSGSWTNSKGESGQSAINISDRNGRIEGDEDGWVIENGRRSGNVLTWEYHNQNNGCCDYSVRWEISADGRTANGTYKVTDRCEKQTYTGEYTSYHK